MAVNKNTLKYSLEKENLPYLITGSYSYTDSIDINCIHEQLESIFQIIGCEYSSFLTRKELKVNEVVTDFLYRAPLYAKNETEINTNIVYPDIRSAHYKGLLQNVASSLIKPIYRYGYPLQLMYIKDNIFIGNGIILDKNLHLLFAIKGDITGEGNNIKFSNPRCVIDKQVFIDKTTVNTFIKNTLFPMLIELGYSIEIDNFNKVEIFEHPIPPQSYEVDEEVTKVLLDNLSAYEE